MIMPKPTLTSLTGGHRRTPILQIGADIYCDTSLIADVENSKASWYSPALNGASRIVAQWADSSSPLPSAYNFQPAGVAEVFAGAPEEAIKAFVADRTAMRGGAPRMSLGEGRST
jgi:hypothetical protein